ncbi:MAG TPA: DUF1573 domain-containing protein [Verrucomicrobiae bacterium]
MSFEPPVWNLGTLQQAETLRCDFQLINRGTNDLRIVGIKSGCDCTVAEKDMTGLVVPARGQIIFPVKYSSGARDGEVRPFMDILLEAKGNRYQARAELKGTIVADVAVHPIHVDFGVLRPGERTNRVVHIRLGTNGTDVTLARPPDAFKVTLVTNTPDGAGQRSADLMVRFEAPQSDATTIFGETILLRTTSPRVPQARFSVSASVVPTVEVRPTMLILREGDPSGESRITIRTVEPSRIARLNVVTDQGSKEVTALPPEKDSGWEEGLEHVRRVSNSLLVRARRLDFELEVRNGADKKEARSASVQIRAF